MVINMSDGSIKIGNTTSNETITFTNNTTGQSGSSNQNSSQNSIANPVDLKQKLDTFGNKAQECIKIAWNDQTFNNYTGKLIKILN